MVVQKLDKADNTKKILVDGQKIPVALVGDTCWYALKDVMKLLGVKTQVCNIAPHISDENKRLFSFGSRSMYVVDLKGIHTMTTMFDINDWTLLSALVECVVSVFNTRQEVISRALDAKIERPELTQSDLLALDVLNAETDEDRIFALVVYKDFLTK